MSYDVIERSNIDGKPVALYEFQFGTKTWRYCAYDAAITVGGNVYQPLSIKDEGYQISGSPADDTISIRSDATIELSNMMNGSPPSETVWVMVRRYHHGDDEAPIVWPGYVASRRLISSVEVEFRCKLLTAGFSRDGARLTYGRGCPYAVYDQDCRANKAAFALTIEVDTVAGDSVASADLAGLDTGYLSGGFFEWARFEGAIERRGIDVHGDGSFTVLGTTAGISAGDLITVYPGCARTRADCKDKFNNLPNYGGFAHLPGKSPFEGSPVF